MTTVTIFGGAGFIGANFVRHVLRETTDRVVVVDKLTYAGHRESLEEVWTHPRFRFVQADIADVEAMKEVFFLFPPDAIVNLAAETHVDRSIDDPKEFVHTNLNGTFVLLELVRDLLRRDPSARESFRFLHISTDEVYGSLGPTDPTFTETSPYAPRSPYAATKAGADHLVQSYFETFGVPTLITNCSNNYGPFQYPEKLVPLMIRNAIEGKPLPIYGDGRNVRDWLYVEDHCSGLLAVLKRGRPGERYNIGGGIERDNISLVNVICSILEESVPAFNNTSLMSKLNHGTGRRPYYADLKTFVPDRPGHDRRYAVNATKIRAELDWRPRYGFEEGLARTVEWYLANGAWCDAVENSEAARQRRGHP